MAELEMLADRRGLAVALGGCGGGSSGPAAPLPVPPAAGDAAPARRDQHLQAWDRVTGSSSRCSGTMTLSGEFALDGAGNFAMPLIGEVQAAGLTTRELEARIRDKLQDGYLLSIRRSSIEVLNYRPFYILGEVKTPGSYPYVNGMTVLNAVALAGGFSYRAKQSDFLLQRGGSNVQGSGGRRRYAAAAGRHRHRAGAVLLAGIPTEALRGGHERLAARRAGLSGAQGPGGAAARLRERPAPAAHPVHADLLAGRGQGRHGVRSACSPWSACPTPGSSSGRRSSIGCRCRCFHRLLGRRRGWLLFVQLLLAARHRRARRQRPAAGSAVGWRCWRLLVAFLSASQDIVIDAYRVELLEERQQGAGAAAVVIGYRVAMLLAGAGALVIAQFAGWFWAYAAMAGCLGLGIVTVLLAPEPEARRRRLEPGRVDGRHVAEAGGGRAVRRLLPPQRSSARRC